jgi:N6-L-threonylcarbamoyladenine synthase
VDRLAREGDALRFTFSKPRLDGFDFSFSGLKTSFLYFLRDHLKEDPEFVEKNRADLAASLQHTIIDILLNKLRKAMRKSGINQVALAGGVSANSGLRATLAKEAEKRGWDLFIPPISFTTDNAAMIAITGYYRYLKGEFSRDDIGPLARMYF